MYNGSIQFSSKDIMNRKTASDALLALVETATKLGLKIEHAEFVEEPSPRPVRARFFMAPTL